MTKSNPPSESKSDSKVAQRQLPFQYQLLAGAIAGVTELSVLYPLDVVKTRLQLQVGKPTASDGYTSITDCFRKIIKAEGFWRLYRGILPPVLVDAPKRAIKFAANEQYTLLYRRLFKVEDNMTRPLIALTGVSAGCTEAVVVVPFELIKVRLQDKGNAGRYNSTVDCFIKIMRQEGPLAFFTGMEATVWRHATWNGGYFSSIGYINDILPRPKSGIEEMRSKFIAGMVGGIVGTIINTPFDVVKTRIQNQGVVPSGAAGASHEVYGWTIPAIKKIAQKEGLAALYKGFMPKVLRLGPGGGILYVVYDQVTSFMKKYL